jgi:hypothetical protein
VVTEVPRMKKCVTVLDIIQQLLQRCSIGFLNEEIEWKRKPETQK